MNQNKHFSPLGRLATVRCLTMEGSVHPDGSTEGDPPRAELRRTIAQDLARQGHDSVTVLGLREAVEVLTPARLDVIEALRGGEYASVGSLARDLGRDKGSVSKDLAALSELGITTLEADGQAKQPVLRPGWTVIEPLAGE